MKTPVLGSRKLKSPDRLIRRARIAAVFVVLSLMLPATGWSQVRVDGDVPKARVFAAADLAPLPQRKVEVRDDKGGKATYEGVDAVELLRHTGAPLGEDLRGAKMRLYVSVEARDRYQVVFALADFDPGFTDNVILLADKRDGKPLSAQEGPFRLIVPADKRHARWVKQVIGLTVRTAPAASARGTK